MKQVMSRREAMAVMGAQDGRGTVWTVEQGQLAQRRVSLGPALLNGTLPIVAGLVAMAALAPVVGGVKVTCPPATGSLKVTAKWTVADVAGLASAGATASVACRNGGAGGCGFT